MASSKEVSTKESATITIDLEVILVPISIILAAIMISASILYSFRDGSVSVGNSNSGSDSGSTATGGGSVNSIVEAIDVDLGDFESCIEDKDFASEIAKDTSDGGAAGITGTPGFIVGFLGSDGKVEGTVVSGAQPYATFSSTIDSYLNGSGNKTASVNIDDDPILGDKSKAKVAIVEFSDFECPFCQRFHNETFDQIVSNYVDSDKIVYVYRDFPLSFHEPKASEAATAANCVREVAGDEKFFEFSKMYYEQTLSNGSGLPS